MNSVLKCTFFPVTSHSLILGTDYLMSNGVILDFAKMNLMMNNANVKSLKRLNLDPQTETIVFARVPKSKIT